MTPYFSKWWHRLNFFPYETIWADFSYSILKDIDIRGILYSCTLSLMGSWKKWEVNVYGQSVIMSWKMYMFWGFWCTLPEPLCHISFTLTADGVPTLTSAQHRIWWCYDHPSLHGNLIFFFLNTSSLSSERLVFLFSTAGNDLQGQRTNSTFLTFGSKWLVSYLGVQVLNKTSYKSHFSGRLFWCLMRRDFSGSLEK